MSWGKPVCSAMDLRVSASCASGSGCVQPSQIRRLRDFQKRHKDQSAEMLSRLEQSASEGGNVFAVLMDAVRCCSLGEITHALFEAGGQYRRNV